MLWDTAVMVGCATIGSDGEGGTVSDMLFDDTTWRVRWIVVNTRHWSPHREVLLPVSVLGRPDPLHRRLAIALAVRQIEDSPTVEKHLPVSRRSTSSRRDDPHLRSVEAIVGHRVHLRDAVIGHVEELLVDDVDWSIRYVRVDTCKWHPGDRVLLAPRLVREISWRGRRVRLDVSREELEADRAQRDVKWLRGQNDETHSDTRPPDQAQTSLSTARRG